ncbi:MAG TPA: pyridoxal phosphate-dependent aminotransferase [Devosiaceae bacterium]|nr:pyridoxal phosphate-dependent aminotransferase [Devosiaceae bacterium]
MNGPAAALKPNLATEAAAFPPLPRPAILNLGASRIRDIANAAMGRSDVAAFWFGESDVPTPGFIREAGAMAIAAGETYYTQNLGLPELRVAIGAYIGRLHGTPVAPGRIAVVASGVSGLMLAQQMLVSPGDRVVIVTPIWPNLTEQPQILGGEVVRVPLEVEGGRWTLDLDRLRDALTPQTRVLVLNSPNNPTGWTIAQDALEEVFALCRRYGIWVITDDAYERLIYTGARSAPSLLPIADPEDRLVSVNTFSKAWSMTGWRIGWMVAPEPFIEELGKVIEYNTSCVPKFTQLGALAAIEGNRGEAAVADLVTGLRASRQMLVEGLSRHPGIEVPAADGAMYAFLRIHGIADDMALAHELLATTGLGLAPGSAFGPEGQGWLRWCFAARPEKIADGLARLDRYLAAKGIQ